ncbi:hypothetical protein PUV54_12815 [Hyphococcus flavus]|uniref:Uncharacterized protein n=1 Tax=Hyphococcus flavus TaxID=1866326 RepID=A0AAF0CE71_9PROT|nr:hypothetical protein [Hyphococcus flavus]WDI30836.1 hypothetical protein PUV54_12815 [Hyphococcus flavus]
MWRSAPRSPTRRLNNGANHRQILIMAMMTRITSEKVLSCAVSGALILLLAAACDNGGAEQNTPASEQRALSEKSDESKTGVADASQPQSANQSDGHDEILFASNAELCEAVVSRVRQSSVPYVRWVEIDDDVANVTLDYFNDGVSRTIERRKGMLAGNNIVTLWSDTGAGEFVRLDLGHAGANTKNLPAIENLHTKLTYSTADIIDLDGSIRTLVTPLQDVSTPGDFYVINWSVKAGAAAPFAPRDYYPYVDCVINQMASDG